MMCYFYLILSLLRVWPLAVVSRGIAYFGILRGRLMEAYINWVALSVAPDFCIFGHYVVFIGNTSWP